MSNIINQYNDNNNQSEVTIFTNISLSIITKIFNYYPYDILSYLEDIKNISIYKYILSRRPNITSSSFKRVFKFNKNYLNDEAYSLTYLQYCPVDKLKFATGHYGKVSLWSSSSSDYIIITLVKMLKYDVRYSPSSEVLICLSSSKLIDVIDLYKGKHSYSINLDYTPLNMFFYESSMLFRLSIVIPYLSILTIGLNSHECETVIKKDDVENNFYLSASILLNTSNYLLCSNTNGRLFLFQIINKETKTNDIIYKHKSFNFYILYISKSNINDMSISIKDPLSFIEFTDNRVGIESSDMILRIISLPKLTLLQIIKMPICFGMRLLLFGNEVLENIVLTTDQTHKKLLFILPFINGKKKIIDLKINNNLIFKGNIRFIKYDKGVYMYNSNSIYEIKIF